MDNVIEKTDTPEAEAAGETVEQIGDAEGEEKAESSPEKPRFPYWVILTGLLVLGFAAMGVLRLRK